MTVEQAFHTGRPNGDALQPSAISRRSSDASLDFGVIGNFVGGAWSVPDGAPLQDVVNPATGKRHAQVVLSSGAEVSRAVDAAQSAFQEWRRTPPIDRARYFFTLRDLLEREFDNLARMITQDHGKTLDDARGEMRRAIENVEVACGIPSLMMGYGLEDGAARGIDEWAIRTPLGVFAAICPFNFPAMVPFWFLPYAIATGNTFIVKPSEQVPVAMARIVELMDEAGFPPGVINLVNGGRETVDALLDEPRIQGISFVGSSPVAKYIYERAAGQGKRVQAQGGAKNCLVVMPDAVPVLEKAVPNILGASFGAAGQRCLAGSMLVTVENAHKPAVEAVVEASRKIKLGYGLEPGVDLGPVISSAAKQRIGNAIGEGERSGAKLLLNGRDVRVEGYEEGYFVGPTVLDGVSPEMPIAQQEIFGPVLGVTNVGSLQEAIDRINASPYGNAASIYTQSGQASRDFRYQVVAGNIGINVGVAAPMAYFPFAGMKQSFYGTQHGQGRDAIDFFTDRKVVVERWL
ncbi:MAG TPA: CoA-acylating methylmalonate-semialdehyde dehydrogenase [Chloroflexota bacterium]|nr:CoA-acylating methylmalonate-semialdehyde dehydrogenase [Chloroflexota bacterium]